MGTCGGAASSFLVFAGRRGGDRGRRDYPARRRVWTSPSGRVVCLCVILMLFQARVPNYGFLPANRPQSEAKTIPYRVVVFNMTGFLSQIIAPHEPTNRR